MLLIEEGHESGSIAQRDMTYHHIMSNFDLHG